jgi:hypothetical protein
MKKIRKQLCFILTLLMVVCMFPVTSQAVTALPASGNNWQLGDDGLLTITDNTGMNDWLTSVNGKFRYNGYVESVVIGNAVTGINASAFSGLYDLTSVTIGNSVRTIGDCAFSYCDNLANVRIGTGVTDIGNVAFKDCIKLTSVAIPASVTSIGSAAFQGCSGLTDVTLGNSVTMIGANAFDSCSRLGDVTLGNSVTTIGAFAFNGCVGLTRVEIPASVRSIGDYAFSGCNSLGSANFLGTTPPAVGTWIFNQSGSRPNIFVPVNSLTDYNLSDLYVYFPSNIFPQSVAITKNSATTYYPTLTNALAAAQNGDTVKLQSDITESSIYTISADTTVTIDGMGHKVTGVSSTESIALSISGTGTLNLKDITLQGGTLQGGTNSVSKGLVVSGSVNVNSYGTVAARGGETPTSYGLINYSSGTVNVTTVYANATGYTGYGVYNIGAGTVNVSTAIVPSTIMGGVGVYNGGSGTVNVSKAEGPYTPGCEGVSNPGTGTVNVGIAGGFFGVYCSGAGTVNAGIASAAAISPNYYSVYNPNSGNVNVSTIIGTTSNGGTGSINTGASVAAVTLNKGDGATCVLDSITVASTGTTTIGKLPSVCKNGTYSDVWYTNSAKTTLFTGTTVTGAATLYSNYYTVPVVPPVVPHDSKGSGGGGGGSVVSTSEITKTVSGNTTTFNIPKAALGLPANGGTDAFKVSAADASISFDKGALSTIMDAAGDIKITATKIDTANLSEETKQLVGDRPVFDFSVTSGNKTVSKFGGTVTVSVPYTPKAGEDPNAIVIYYINAEGKPEMVSNCAYDPATGTITFTTDHFSKYAVGYNKVNFSDVAENAWYGDAVSFVAARDITTGTGNGNFSPTEKLTRGQFLVMVMRAYGIEAETASNDNFSDAGNTYYTGYLAAAKSLGITDGIGNNMFAPEKEITRQEMFTLLYNTLDSIGELPAGTTGTSLTSYRDADKIASWAKDAMTLFVGTGTVSGSGDQLNPSGTTNRAEMAQVLYNLLSK